MDFFDLDGNFWDFSYDDHDSGVQFDDLDADNTIDDYVLNQSMDDPYYNVVFQGSENSDGYIPEGKITLERTISGSSDTFPHYVKAGHDFVKVNGRYIQVDVGETVTINNIKYDTI